MPVTIGEFEVVPAAPAPSLPTAEAPAAAPALDEQALARWLDVLRELQLRTWAH